MRKPDIVARIENTRHRLTTDIREYVRSQQEEWRLVPWLALQADGRGGYSEHHSYAYHHGRWFVHEFGTGPLIDCASGELVRMNGRLLNDHSVLELANSLNAITAKEVIAQLQYQAAHGDFSGHTKAELDRREQWRQRLAKKLHLKPCYVRPKTRKAA
jgi:hypothetical protein